MSNPPVIRIERGHPDEHEIIALALVLAMAATASADTEPPQPAPVRWVHPERRIAFVAQHSWAAAA